MIVLTVAFVENLSACPPYKVFYKRAPDKGLWWFWHSEVWPGREVEVSYGAHLRQSCESESENESESCELEVSYGACDKVSTMAWIQLKWEELLMNT